MLPAPVAVLAAQPSAHETAPEYQAGDDDLARVKAAGKIMVGTSADYEPFEFYSSNFSLDGFDIVLMRELGKRMGVEVEFNDFAFDGLLALHRVKIIHQRTFDQLLFRADKLVERLFADAKALG